MATTGWRSGSFATAVCGLALTVFSTAGVQAAEAAAPKNILFIAGPPSHGPGEHEHRAGSMLLADQLNKSGMPVKVTVVSGWPADESVLDTAAAVVIYADGGGGHLAIPHLTKLKELSAHGTGIGCLHYAVEVPKGEPGNAFLDTIGGYFEADWSVNPVWTASFQLPQHGVTRGVKPFSIEDEWYYHMRFRPDKEGVTPILTALPPKETLERGEGPHEGNPAVRAAVLDRKEPQDVMWLYEKGEVRGFGFTGGHYHKNWQKDDLRRLVLNAAVWLAHVEVPQGGVPTKTPTDEEMKANLDKKGH